MEFTFLQLVLLPVGLGLLGFIEPCTVGGHLLFLDSQKGRAQGQKFQAFLTFLFARSLVAGMFGAAVSLLGRLVIGAQTAFWLAFGLTYLAIGIAFVSGKGGFLRHEISLISRQWAIARKPQLAGIVLGLNIPACAAPILFGLLGLAATTGTAATGFAMMFIFGVSLSLPLTLFLFAPRISSSFENWTRKLKGVKWLIGLVFIVLGLWSIWFGLNVDPEDWAGI